MLLGLYLAITGRAWLAPLVIRDLIDLEEETPFSGCATLYPGETLSLIGAAVRDADLVMVVSPVGPPLVARAPGDYNCPGRLLLLFDEHAPYRITARDPIDACWSAAVGQPTRPAFAYYGVDNLSVSEPLVVFTKARPITESVRDSCHITVTRVAGVALRGYFTEVAPVNTTRCPVDFPETGAAASLTPAHAKFASYDAEVHQKCLYVSA